MKWRKICSGAAAFMMAFAIAAFLLAGLLEICGTNQPLMKSLMLECAPPERTGLAEDEYEGVTLMITRYLAGAIDTFSYQLDDGYGRMIEAFNEDEQAHMADCYGLFVLDRKVLLVSAVIAVLLGALAALPGVKRSAAIGCMAGSCAALLCVAGLAVWAAVDFNGLFVLFHRLSFSNNLWIMNPSEDLIVRLMPTAFFVRYVTGIAVIWLAGLAAMAAVSGAVAFRRKDRAGRYRG